MANTNDELQRAIYQTHPHLEEQHRDEERAVRDLGERIGYGRLMQLAADCWREWAIARGLPGSEFAIGPCAAFMVQCPCPESGRDANGHCEWCCGSGRVTERVRQAMDPGQIRALEDALREALDGWAESYAGDPSISSAEAAIPHPRVEELRTLLEGPDKTASRERCPVRVDGNHIWIPFEPRFVLRRPDGSDAYATARIDPARWECCKACGEPRPAIREA